MIYSQEQICRRILLAKCCYADLVSKLIEARWTGDAVTADCIRNKLDTLQNAIQALCRGYVPYHDVPVQQTQLFLEASSTGPNPRITSLLYRGVAIVASGTTLGTGDATAKDLVEAVLAQPRGNTMIFEPTHIQSRTGSDMVKIVATTNIIDSVRGGITFSGSDLDVTLSSAEGPVLAEQGEPFCLTNDEVTIILGNIDDICGCPCGCGDPTTEKRPNQRLK